MNILFVVLSPIKGNTSGIISNIGLMNGLMKLGNKITILTVKEYGDNVVNKTNLFTEDNYEIIYVETSFLYKTVVDQRKKSGFYKKILSILRKIYYKIKIMDNMTTVAKSLNVEILKEKKYDMIISASDPKSSHLAVKYLIAQGIKYRKWVEYWGDPLTFDITRHNIYPVFINKIVENRLLKEADKICYVSPFTCEKQKDQFPHLAEKMFFLPLPYDRKRIIEKRPNRVTIKLGYFGDYNSNIRNIIPLYNAVKLNSNISLIIAGSSDIDLKSRSNIEILPRISRKKIEILEEDCDVLVCVLNKYGSQIPGKVYYAAATNKVILVILDGEQKEKIGNFLEQYDRYFICDNNEKEIQKAINKIKKNKKEYNPIDEFSPLKIAEKFICESGI